MSSGSSSTVSKESALLGAAGCLAAGFVAGYLVRDKLTGPKSEYGTTASAPAASSKTHGPGYATPLEAMKGPREKIVYLPALYAPGSGKRDYMATVDVDEKSDTFCQVIHRTELGIDDEIHHFGWDACSSCHKDPSKRRRHLIVPGLKSGNIYVLSTAEERAPKIVRMIPGDEIKEKYDLSFPHTSHCLADGNVMISYMGDAKGDGKGEFLLLDSEKNFDFAEKPLWTKDGKTTRYGYDFWYQPRCNVMISTEWGSPSAFSKGFNPAQIASHYGSKLYVWDWEKHELKQEIDLGAEGLIPLEIRFHHEPSSKHGFVGAALSSSIFHFYEDKDTGLWKADKVIQVEPVNLEGWALPAAPGLITDLLLSLDDKYLYFANWLHGDIRQYDVSDPFNPKLTGQVFLGGLYQEGTAFKPTDANVKRPKNPAPKGVFLQGGPQMIQLSLDGTRLYCTNSLYSPWDKQFYPEMIQKGSQLIRINCDVVNGGISLDENFVVDFGKEPNGPSLAHEVRYPGGDCTSDIWI